jgi:hypothetical protein
VSAAAAPTTSSDWPRGRPRTWTVNRLLLKLMTVALSVLVASDVFGGVIRFGLSKLGVPFLSYLPMLFSAVLAFACFAHRMATSRLELRTFAILVFFAVYAVYSILVGAATGVASGGAGVGRVAFALYTWTPFFLGLALAGEGAETQLVRRASLWWALAIAGVVLNRFVHFPWTGSTFEVLGQESQVARDWTTNGLDRLAGFSRASFTAANEITVFGVVLIALPATRPAVGALVWVVSAAAVALTTAKTPLVALLLVPVALWTQRARPDVRGQRQEGRFFVAMALLAAFMAMLVALPISSATQDLFFKYSFGEVGFLSVASMLDRITGMWPDAFALVGDDRNPLEWVFGRGLGGIGSAQGIFEPNAENTADNMFVFLYVTFGASCVVFGLAIFSRFRDIYRENGERFLLFLAMAGSVLTLGVATNVIESIVPAIVLGILTGKSSQPLERAAAGTASRM